MIDISKQTVSINCPECKRAITVSLKQGTFLRLLTKIPYTKEVGRTLLRARAKEGRNPN